VSHSATKSRGLPAPLSLGSLPVLASLSSFPLFHHSVLLTSRSPLPMMAAVFLSATQSARASPFIPWRQLWSCHCWSLFGTDGIPPEMRAFADKACTGSIHVTGSSFRHTYKGAEASPLVCMRVGSSQTALRLASNSSAPQHWHMPHRLELGPRTGSGVHSPPTRLQEGAEHVEGTFPNAPPPRKAHLEHVT